MKSLILIRHGIAAEYPQWEGSDETRPLTEEGITRFQKSASGVAPFLSQVGTLLSSPYVRACQTAEILGSTLGIPYQKVPELACGIRGDRLAASLVKALSDKDMIAYVGHEPDLSTAIQFLLKAPFPPVVVKKGSITCLELYSESSCQLAWHLTPKISRALAGGKL